MKELVVLSGKGGTGKTSLVAALAALAGETALADGDVDASNLPLVVEPKGIRREEFWGGHKARILPDRCMACGICAEACRFDAIRCSERAPKRRVYRVDPLACEGCGVCRHVCPQQAIEIEPVRSGEWYLSETRHGPMVHARLAPGGENSGKLVTLVRNEARNVAAAREFPLVLLDGPPGVGCPVIASLGGADLALAVTEPTCAGREDLKRLAALAAHFTVPLAVCLNKADLNEEVGRAIEDWCRERGVPFVGRIPYAPEFLDAQEQRRSVVELNGGGEAARAIREVWGRIRTLLGVTG